mmetsp:Transcript_28278/g.59425  ORF Transcript_28278/g.59425 Transcript_28278/m.59425 type:complete len:247 (-) Transcript_28278:531-1271(-)
MRHIGRRSGATWTAGGRRSKLQTPRRRRSSSSGWGRALQPRRPEPRYGQTGSLRPSARVCCNRWSTCLRSCRSGLSCARRSATSRLSLSSASAPSSTTTPLRREPKSTTTQTFITHFSVSFWTTGMTTCRLRLSRPSSRARRGRRTIGRARAGSSRTKCSRSCRISCFQSSLSGPSSSPSSSRRCSAPARAPRPRRRPNEAKARTRLRTAQWTTTRMQSLTQPCFKHKCSSGIDVMLGNANSLTHP